jgi:hypothetical protein
MSHAPKQRALEAYVADQLSPRGQLRLERHLATCDNCRETLVQVRAYGRLRLEARDQEVPELDWERMQAALEAEALFGSRAEPRASTPTPAADTVRLVQPGAQRAQPRPRGKWIALTWPLLAVAATLAIAWIGLHGGQGVEDARAPGAAAKLAQTSAPRAGRVSLIAGEAWLEQAGSRTPLTLASEVPEGARLITGADALVHVLLADGTGFALGADGSLRLGELTPAGIRLDLERGSLSNQVRKLEAQQHYVVTLGALSARVRGTRFVVEGNAQGAPTSGPARVFVHEGRVEVARDGAIVALLGPGQGFESPTPSTPTPPAPERVIQGIDTSLSALTDAWGTLTLPGMDALHAWIVAGERVAPEGGLRMRLPRGPTQLTFEDARGQVRSVTVELQERETVLEPALLAKLVAAREVRAGRLAPEQITQVFRAGLDPLRRCYERGLRVRPTLAGKFTLRMRVGADGRVQRAEPQDSGELPAEIARCISQEALRLVFPKPEGNGPVSFEVPLNLKSH